MLKLESIKINKITQDKNKLIFVIVTAIIGILPFILLSVGDLGYVGNTVLGLKWLIIAIPRIGIPALFSIYIFKLFYSQEKHFFMDVKHLFAWHFLFVVAAKLFDIYLVIESNGNISALESNPAFLPILKARWLVIILVLTPIYLFFVHIYSKIWAVKYINKSNTYRGTATPTQMDTLQKRIEKIADLAFVALTLTLTFAAQSYSSLRAISPLFTFPVIIMGIVTFKSLYKHKRLPQMYSYLIMIGYVIYIISSVLRAIVTNLEVSYFFEAFEAISFFCMGMSFIIPPPYGVKTAEKKEDE